MPGSAATFREFKAGKLRSGSKKGPLVTNPKQAIAIALSEGRKAGEDIPDASKRRKSLIGAKGPHTEFPGGFKRA